MIKLKAKLKKVEEMKTETKFIFSTKEELDPLEIYGSEGAIGYFVFNKDELSQKAIEVMKNRKFGVDGNFSPSAQLRGEIWHLWNEKYQDQYDPEEFYLKWMRHFTDMIKQKRNV